MRRSTLTDCVSVMALSLESSDTSVSTFRLMRPSDKHDRSEVQADAEFLELDLGLAVPDGGLCR